MFCFNDFLSENYKKCRFEVPIVIKKNYPYVQTLSLKDNSYKVCDNGHVVELSEMTYIRTGKTWYETHFHAVLQEKDRQVFTEKEKAFQNLKRAFNWEKMKTSMTNYHILQEEKAKPLFEEAKTWQDFFGPLSNTMNTSEFCMFVAPWLQDFLSQSLRFNFSSPLYHIQLRDALFDTQIAYEEMPYTQGGKRFTMKKLKQRDLRCME